MPSLIVSELDNFTQALVEGKRIDCSREGEWFEEGFFMRSVRWLLGWEDDRVVNVASAFNRVLDSLEKVPVKFNGTAAEMELQNKHFDLHLKAAEAVKKQLEAMDTRNSKSKLYELSCKVAALKYRMEKENGGLSKEATVSSQLVGEVKGLAEKWKQDYPLYRDKKLSEGELAKIEETCRYPEFVELIKFDEPLRTLFFKWALRDGCDVDAFVQFPSTSTRIKNAFLAGRIGRFCWQSDLLHQKNRETGEYSDLGQPIKASWEKHYTLPVELLEEGKLVVKEESVLEDGKVLNLNLNYKQTMKEIIASVANRNREPGNIEMLGRRRLESGEWLRPRLANHQSLEIAPYNPATKDFERPDLSPGKKEWWKSIPPLDTVDFSELKTLYGVETLKAGEWLAVVRSSREDAGRDVDRSHGFLDVVIPAGDGKFEIYAFGKYAAVWPDSMVEKALFITNTLPSKIECPDENHFMAQRQQAMAVKPIKEADGLELMEEIRKDLIKAREGNIVFQFPWENCAWWSQKRLEKLLGSAKHGGPVPNYFRSPLLDANPKIPPLPLIFRVCRAVGEGLRRIIIKVVECILLAWRGTTVEEKGKSVFKSVSNSGHMRKLEIYHPSTLHERIIAKEVKNSRITMSNLHLVQASA